MIEPVPLFLVGPELLVLVAVGVLLFGASRIPKVAKATGRSIGEFQKGKEEAEQEVEQLRQQAEDQLSVSSSPTDDTDEDTPGDK